MPPANDLPANAELLPVGAYWGVTSGTTVGADEDVFVGWGAQVVWYYWSALPAGTVYVYVRPTTDTYLEAALIAGMPTDVTEGSEWFGFGSHDTTPAMFQAQHEGGPLTLVVLTYTPDECDFDLGWGHELDADPTHWDDTPHTAPWSSTTSVALPTIQERAGTYSVSQTGPNPSPTPNLADIDCAMANARRAAGGSTATPCSPAAAGPGGYLNGYGPGYWLNQGVLSVPPPFTRTDSAEVDQAMLAFRVPTQHGPIPPDTRPDTWYAETHGGDIDQSAGFNWGWTYLSSDWETGELAFTVHASAIDFTEDHFLHHDPCTPALCLVPQAMMVDSFDPSAPNQVHVNYGSSPPIFEDYTFLDIDALGEVLYGFPPNPPAGDYTAVVAGWGDYVQGRPDGSKGTYLIGCWVSQESLDHVRPTVLTVPALEQHSVIATRSVTIEEILRCQYRTPAYGTYRGFPLVPPEPGAWHIGRTAVGAW
jgi:hypothetical protein